MVTLCAHAAPNVTFAGSINPLSSWISLSPAALVFIKNDYLEELQTCIFFKFYLMIGF
jgi:hypothetical protein